MGPPSPPARELALADRLDWIMISRLCPAQPPHMSVTDPRSQDAVQQITLAFGEILGIRDQASNPIFKVVSPLTLAGFGLIPDHISDGVARVSTFPLR